MSILYYEHYNKSRIDSEIITQNLVTFCEVQCHFGNYFNHQMNSYRNINKAQHPQSDQLSAYVLTKQRKPAARRIIHSHEVREILLSLFSVSRLRLLLYRFLVYNLNCVMLLAYCSTIKLCIMHVYVHNTHIFERVRACVRSCVCVCVYLFFFLPVCEHSCVHLCECKLCVYKD